MTILTGLQICLHPSDTAATGTCSHNQSDHSRTLPWMLFKCTVSPDRLSSKNSTASVLRILEEEMSNRKALQTDKQYPYTLILEWSLRATSKYAQLREADGRWKLLGINSTNWFQQTVDQGPWQPIPRGKKI